MSGLTFGFWDILDQTLRWIGKSATGFLRKPGQEAENVVYATIGGALVCAVYGGVVGFALSDFSRRITTIDGAAIGVLIGACIGVFLGAFVDMVDSKIHDLLRSSNSEIDIARTNVRKC